jgi:hypothetical protein
MDCIPQGNFEKSLFLSPLQNTHTASSERGITLLVIQPQAFGQITQGKKTTLENIYFDPSNLVLREASYKQLTQLLKENSTLKIDMSSYKDNAGDFHENAKGFKEYCESMLKYEGGQEIPINQMTAVGKSPLIPIPQQRKTKRKIDEWNLWRYGILWLLFK